LSMTQQQVGAAGQNGTLEIYILEDVAHQQWCAYRNESAWNSDVQSLQAMTVGTIKYVGGRPSEVAVVTDPSAFTFSRFLDDNYVRASEMGKVCVQAGIRRGRL